MTNTRRDVVGINIGGDGTVRWITGDVPVQPVITVDVFAWLVERNDPSMPPRYLSGFGYFGDMRWSVEPNDAIRFARQADAEKVLPAVSRGAPCRVTEHGWSS